MWWSTDIGVVGLALVAAVTAAAGAEPRSEVRALNPEVRSGSQTQAAASKGERSAAETLYVSKCAKCHKFYDPAKYSDSQWAKWMVKMGKKARLSPEQQKELSDYIQGKYRSNAKAVASARRLAPGEQ